MISLLLRVLPVLLPLAWVLLVAVVVAACRAAARGDVRREQHGPSSSEGARPIAGGA